MLVIASGRRIVDVLLHWLPALVAALVCGLLTFAWAAHISAWGGHVRGDAARAQWLPGPTTRVVGLAALAIWLLAVAGGWVLTGPSADGGRVLIAVGSVVLGLVATLAVWFLSEMPQDIHRFCGGCVLCMPFHAGGCGGGLQHVRTDPLLCETCGSRLTYGDATDEEPRLHIGCGGRLELLSCSCGACGTLFTRDALRRMYDELPQVPPSRLDILFRSGATMAYGSVGGALAGVVVALAIASWAGAAGGTAAVVVAVIGGVGAPILFVLGLIAVAFAGI